jgi:8-oxo-dGTP pyrophosphatase MutT (NUDIX family)
MALGENGVVRAAGGIVTRRTPEAGIEVLLVHRAAYDDWAFPKGKADSGESDEACALREVEEETGLRCAIDRAVGETSYRDARGRPKVVRYFAMRPVAGEIALLHEVDDARWLPVENALAALSYERDRELLRVSTPS